MSVLFINKMNLFSQFCLLCIVRDWNSYWSPLVCECIQYFNPTGIRLNLRSCLLFSVVLKFLQILGLCRNSIELLIEINESKLKSIIFICIVKITQLEISLTNKISESNENVINVTITNVRIVIPLISQTILLDCPNWTLWLS